MICPECLSKDLIEQGFDPDKQDITYECNVCHTKIVVNITPEDEVPAYEREHNLITEPAV